MEARFRGYVKACRAAGVFVPEEPDLRVGMMTQAEGARAVLPVSITRRGSCGCAGHGT